VNETAPEREEKMLNPVQLQNLAREKMQTLHKEAQTRQLLQKPLRATWKKEDNVRIVWVGSHASPILVND
jgi:hypothetical protein